MRDIRRGGSVANQQNLVVRVVVGVVVGAFVGAVFEAITRGTGKIVDGMFIWAIIGLVMGMAHRTVDVASGGIVGAAIGAIIGVWLGGGIVLMIAILACEVIGARIGRMISDRILSADNDKATR